MLDVLLRLPDPHVLELGVVHDVHRPAEFARDCLRRHRLPGARRSREQEAEPLRLLDDLLQAPPTVHEALVPQLGEGVEQALLRRFGEDQIVHRVSGRDELRDGTDRLMQVRLRGFPLLVRLVDLDAGVEEADDPTDVLPRNVATRFANATALRALHNPFVAVRLPRSHSSQASRANFAADARPKTPYRI